ncbi:MAG: hypothetical protein HZC24_09085 [Rhodocyclales bacterium]|nr:hypothetical protein [Rhodocyclales bacterium]
MPGFENYGREAAEIEREIVRRGLVLGIDWEDAAQVRTLAREALAARHVADMPEDLHARAKLELFGLAQLMLTVMRQSADDGMHTHGGAAWKALARALWQEAGAG